MDKANKGIVLYVATIEIAFWDIPRILDELGFDVYTASLGVPLQGFDKEASDRIVSAIQEYKVDYVISCDFSESIAQACFEADVSYVSWVYDAPQMELYTHYAQYPCNYVFVFDGMQQKRLSDIGIKQVYHVPLAVHVEKIKMMLETTKCEEKAYVNDVSFVGQLYYSERVEKPYKEAPQDIKEKIDENIRECFLKWDESTHMHGIMDESVVAYFSALDNHSMVERYPYITEQFDYEATVLSRLLAHRERVYILNTLAERFHVALYTYHDASVLSPKVQVLPGFKYDYETLQVYPQSKINLNITLHCIETGISQRVFDVMSAGGFMLSNYQKELEELFIPGEEIVLYHNMEELEYYVEYYLSHDEERKKIAQKGQEKIFRLHDFKDRLSEVMEIVYDKEKNRKESYFDIQKKELIKITESCLQSGQDTDYKYLWQVYNMHKYENVIRRTTAFSTFWNVLRCYTAESMFKKPKVFEQIKTVSVAEERYLQVKNAVEKLEMDFSEDNCLKLAQFLQKDTTLSFLFVWMIYVTVTQKEDAYLVISSYLSESSLALAIEFVTCALWCMEESDKLLLYKANYLLEAAMWQESLATLKLIKKPSEDILLLIQELESISSERI